MDIHELLTKKNVGGFDLLARSLFGTIAMIALAMDMADGMAEVALAVVAFIGVFTSLTQHCTPYALLGLSTCRCRHKGA